MTVEELAALLASHTDAEFVDAQLPDRRPWIFNGDAQYEGWRSRVSDALGVQEQDLIIVGSAATGYSLSPLKPGRPFRHAVAPSGSASDIDIAIIDSDLFIMAWNEILRRDRMRTLGGTEDSRDKIRFDIYHGGIGQQTLPRNTEPARAVRSAMAIAGRSPPLRGYQLRSRVYRRMEDLRSYHISSLRQLRAQLAP